MSKKKKNSKKNSNPIKTIIKNAPDTQGETLVSSVDTLNPKDEVEVITKDKLPFDVHEDEDNVFFPIVLTPTAHGKHILDEIQRKKNLKLQDKETAIPEVKDSGEIELPKKFNFEEFERSLDKATEHITESGKYGRAKDDVREVSILEFIKIYQSGDDAAYDAIARKLINLGKSFYEYDQKHREFLTDADYDKLLARYLERGNIEPSGIIPKGKKNMKKVPIKYPTLHNNMDKSYAVYINDPIPEGVKEKDCVERFLQRIYKTLSITSETEIQIEVSPKIDGVSVNGTVFGDMIKNPQTRGDADESVSIIGMNGLQITTHDNDAEFGIQYEAFVTDSDRIAASNYLKMGDNPYVSCRHAASGIISRLTTKEDNDLLQFLSLYPIAAEGLDGCYSEQMDYLQNFAVVPKDMPDRKIIKGDLKTLLKKIDKQFHKLEELRPNLSFAIDGMVLTVVDDDYQKTIGREGRTNKYQIALKFDPSTAVGVVKGIWMDTGRKGYRTLQVDLEEPVFLDGVRYDHVPVLSAELFNDLELREGSKVTVHRVGDVIPAIKVMEAGNGERIKLPTECPICHEPLMVKARKLYCANPLCKGNITGRLVEFFDKLGMEDYGTSFAETLQSEFGVTNLGGLFILINPDTIKDSGIKSKKLNEFLDVLKEAIRNTADYKIVGAMGIPGVGPQKAKMLLKMYGLDGLCKLDLISTGSHETLLANCLKLVGATTYEATCSFLESDVFQDDIKAIVPYVKKITKDFDSVYTVGHSGYSPSEEVKLACEKEGWEITDGRKFNVLLVSSKDQNSTKVTIANKKGLPIVTEEEFINMVESRHHISA